MKFYLCRASGYGRASKIRAKAVAYHTLWLLRVRYCRVLHCAGGSPTDCNQGAREHRSQQPGNMMKQMNYTVLSLTELDRQINAGMGYTFLEELGTKWKARDCNSARLLCPI